MRLVLIEGHVLHKPWRKTCLPSPTPTFSIRTTLSPLTFERSRSGKKALMSDNVCLPQSRRSLVHKAFLQRALLTSLAHTGFGGGLTVVILVHRIQVKNKEFLLHGASISGEYDIEVWWTFACQTTQNLECCWYQFISLHQGAGHHLSQVGPREFSEFWLCWDSYSFTSLFYVPSADSFLSPRPLCRKIFLP